jgi:hypothetical protein
VPQQQVGRFHVAMDPALAMHECKRLGRLPHARQRIRIAHRAAMRDHRSAGGIFHGKEAVAVGNALLERAKDVRMAEPRHRGELPFERGRGNGLVHALRHDLERHGRATAGRERQVHGGRAAASQHALDAVAADMLRGLGGERDRIHHLPSCSRSSSSSVAEA